MQISHVAPQDHLELCDLGDFDFCLAHLVLKNPEYKKFFIERIKQGREVYLDNGVWETGYPLDSDIMIDLSIEMKPTYVYAPDYMGDKNKTLDSIVQFGEKAANTKGFNSKIIGVMQGKTKDEWFDSAVTLSRMPNHICHTIAVNTLFIEDMLALAIVGIR